MASYNTAPRDSPTRVSDSENPSLECAIPRSCRVHAESHSSDAGNSEEPVGLSSASNYDMSRKYVCSKSQSLFSRSQHHRYMHSSINPSSSFDPSPAHHSRTPRSMPESADVLDHHTLQDLFPHLPKSYLRSMVPVCERFRDLSLNHEDEAEHEVSSSMAKGKETESTNVTQGTLWTHSQRLKHFSERDPVQAIRGSHRPESSSRDHEL